MDKSIADLRQDYAAEVLLEKDADADPIQQFRKWWDAATKADIEEPNAMTLATASTDGWPAARIVLLKDFDDRGFVFYSNYDSAKGRQLDENPKACLVFLWKELERQVRITGTVSKVDAAQSDEYFASRPIKSRLGAAASPQSRVIQARDWLEEEYKKKEAQYADGQVPRPENWGGYRVTPHTIEFWQGRRSRLHDRLQYRKHGERWTMERLAP